MYCIVHNSICGLNVNGFLNIGLFQLVCNGLELNFQKLLHEEYNVLVNTFPSKTDS